MSKLSRRKVLKPPASALRNCDRGARHRAADAGAEMAAYNELSEVARHAARQRRDLRQGGRRRDRPQVSDFQVFAAGEIAPPFSAADVVENGTVEQCLTASYYFSART